MKIDYTNKTTLITGGTSGIGFSTAKMFLEKNSNVAIIGRSEKKGKEALTKLKAFKNNIIYIKADISQVSECERIVKEVVSTFGKLDIVVNSAGIYLDGDIGNVTEDAYNTLMDINLKGTFFTCKYAIPELKKSGGGSIINVSSDAGLMGNPLCTLYCASKGAVTIFTKALAVDVAKYKIRVNSVCPGDILTPMFYEDMAKADDPEIYMKKITEQYPSGAIGKPEEVASVICLMASDLVPFVIGASWSIDGGITAATT